MKMIRIIIILYMINLHLQVDYLYQLYATIAC